MSNLVQELYDLEALLEKYAEALNRRIGFNRNEIDDIPAELQKGLDRLQNHIDYRIAFINKKLVRLQRRMAEIKGRLKEAEETGQSASAPEKERKTA
jgi:chromosome segregation ATPase